MNRVLSIFICIIIFLVAACERKVHEPQGRDDLTELDEVKVRRFKLDDELNDRSLEISGLAWYKNYLVILPQFPFKFGSGETGIIYFVQKDELISQIENEFTEPLKYQKVFLEASDLERFNNYGSGYEALTFLADTVFMTIEAFSPERTEGYIVRGLIKPDERKIILNPESIQKIHSPVNLDNMAYETVLAFNNRVITIYEANGRLVNPHPAAHIFKSDLDEETILKMPNIEYRITDATEVEFDSTFWAINYLWSGESDLLKPANDIFFKKFGVGKSQKYLVTVERLIKLKITSDSITSVDHPPVYLNIPSGFESRNWEGIVKLDNRGFILATDKFPGTILAFAPFPTD